MKLAIIEDNDDIIKLMVPVLEAMEKSHGDVAIDRELCEQVAESNYHVVLSRVRELRGGYILFLDLNLISNDRFREELRPKIESQFDPPLSSDERKLLDSFTGQDANFWSGVAIARTAVSNQRLDPLVIVLSSSLGNLNRAKMFVDASVVTTRRTESVRVMNPGENLTAENSPTHCANAIAEFRRAFGDPLRKLLMHISELDHDECHLPAPGAVRALSEFLQLDRGELEDVFGTSLQKCLNSFKGMGLREAEDGALTLLGGWLLALGAFREQWPAESWSAIFETANMDALPDDWAKNPIMPRQRTATLQSTVQTYYDMCLHLFENTGTAAGCGVRAVRLSVTDGLTMRLKFDPFANGNRSLFARIVECSLQSFNGEALHYHQTSKSIWKFWIRSSICDAGRSAIEWDGLFGGSRRFNIRERDGETEVTLG